MTTIALGIPMRRRDPAERPPTLGRPDDDGLVDRFGRVAHDLRVSITERCSLRCTYCMPEEGLPVIPTDQLLTAPEIARLVGIAARDLDVREVRFTGGEPLTRGDLVDIIALSAAAAPGLPLAMTTNAIGLDKKAAALKAAGLGRLNVSLDTIDRAHFAQLTRRDRLPAVIRGVEAAQAVGLGPIKLNAVLMRETLDDAPALLRWAVERGLKLRFIEQMPLDADETWRRDQMVPAAELLEVLGASFSLVPAAREDPSAPAELWTVDGGPATVGIIASVTRSFCADCDRTRLTAEGSIRSCLFGDDETDLRGLLRGGVSDAELADRWRAAMWGKQAGHGIDSATFSRPLRSMGAIGG